jgi:hypothetical protein
VFRWNAAAGWGIAKPAWDWAWEASAVNVTDAGIAGSMTGLSPPERLSRRHWETVHQANNKLYPDH